jgi:hypothetical protein
VDQTLPRMLSSGEVVKRKRGRYVHPDRLDLIPDTLSEVSESQN